ncbi:MAG: hypothetical protein ACRDWD_05260 [Acidimicrobiia bacterium]
MDTLTRDDVEEDAAWAAAIAGGFGVVREQVGLESDRATVEYLAANYSNQVLEVAIQTVVARPDWLRQSGRDPRPELAAWARALPVLLGALERDVVLVPAFKEVRPSDVSYAAVRPVS